MHRKKRAREVVLILVIVSVIAVTLWPVHTGGGYSLNTHCLSNLKQQALATLLYLDDHNDQLPPSERWFDATHPYRKATLGCPKLEHGIGYAMNEGHAELPKRPEAWVMLFETASAERNEHGNLGMILEEPRHGGVTVAFGDGSAVSLRPDKESSIRQKVVDKIRQRRQEYSFL